MSLFLIFFVKFCFNLFAFLGEFCDANFLKATQKELAEALDMTPEEMDRAAHRLLQVENRLVESNPIEDNQSNTVTSTEQADKEAATSIHSPAELYSEDEEDTRL